MSLTIATAIQAGTNAQIGQSLQQWLSQIATCLSGNAQINNVQMTLTMPNGSQVALNFSTTLSNQPMSLADTQTILTDFQTIFNADLTNIENYLAGL